MIRSCLDRLEFKNECYSTVNQVNQQKNNDICINIMVRTKTKPFLKRKKEPKFYFHFGQQKKCPPCSFNIYLAMWKSYMPTLERLKAVGRTQNGAFCCILDIKSV
jgi:hypothetical protein